MLGARSRAAFACRRQPTLCTGVPAPSIAKWLATGDTSEQEHLAPRAVIRHCRLFSRARRISAAVEGRYLDAPAVGAREIRTQFPQFVGKRSLEAEDVLAGAAECERSARGIERHHCA